MSLNGDGELTDTNQAQINYSPSTTMGTLMDETWGNMNTGGLGDDDLISDGSTHYFLSAPSGAFSRIKRRSQIAI